MSSISKTLLLNSFPYTPNYDLYPLKVQYFKYLLTIETKKEWVIKNNNFDFNCFLINKRLVILRAKGRLIPELANSMGKKVWSVLGIKGVSKLIAVSDLTGITKIGIGAPSGMYSLITSNLSKSREFEYIAPSKKIKPLLSIHRIIVPEFRKATQMVGSFEEGLKLGLFHLLKGGLKSKSVENNTKIPTVDLHTLRTNQLIELIKNISWDQNFKPAHCDIPKDDPYRELFLAFHALQKEIGVLLSEVAKYNQNLEYLVCKRTEKIVTQTRKLQALNVQLDRFIYSASHELRAPIASMLGLLKLIDIEPDTNKKDDYINLLEKTIYKQDNILRQIIKLRENNKAVIHKDKINFKQLLNEVIKNLGLSSHSGGINIEIVINQISPFYTDKTRLKIITSNLLKNAFKYNLNKKVQLTIENSNENLIIVIKDNGVGIHPSALPHIFDIFYRASEKNSGSGIGLFMVKEMVKSLGGKINVESELSKGSTFTVNLPCLQTHSFPTL